jgi:hypothetical protein
LRNPANVRIHFAPNCLLQSKGLKFSPNLIPLDLEGACLPVKSPEEKQSPRDLLLRDLGKGHMGMAE